MNLINYINFLFFGVCLVLCQFVNAQTVEITKAEAESGLLTGNVRVSNQVTGYTGSGYVTNFYSLEDQVSVTLSVPATNYYKLVIRYRAPYGTKKENVIINGTTVSDVTFNDSQSFTTLTVGEYLLGSGNTTVTLQCGWGWVDIDQFLLYSVPQKVFSLASTPVNPGISVATKKLYNFMVYTFGKMIISGQTNDYYNNIVQLTGKSPLLRAFDFSSYTQGYPYAWNSKTGTFAFGAVENGSVETAISWYNTTGGKGIVSFHWHWCSPTGGKPGINTFYTQNTTFDILQAIKSGTSENIKILEDIDAIAVQLKKLSAAGIPVLWRPLHEAGGGWFWWGAKGAAACKSLYGIMYDRLTQYHKLNNLIWVWSTPEKDWYPGNSAVDLIGYDSYPGAYNYDVNRSVYNQLFEITNGQKIIAMTENGPIPNPDDCLTYDAPWSYFMSWNDLVLQHNSTQYILDVYNSPKVITLNNTREVWNAMSLVTDTTGLDYPISTSFSKVNDNTIDYSFWPNPSKDKVYIQNRMHVMVYDMKGNLVYDSVNPVSEFSILDIHDGIYLLFMKGLNEQCCKKIIVKKN
jgi:mannan endo-1,4-beta-mannosidase